MKKQSKAVTGEELVAIYVSAMTNLTTAKTAEYMAKKTEDETLSNIKAYSQAQYEQSTNSPVSHQFLVKSSLNAHVQKAQAEEINNLTKQDLTTAESNIKGHYKRKKIQVVVKNFAKKPIDSISFDKRTGRQHVAAMNTKKITGIFNDAVLEENVLILSPTTTSKVLLPNRKFFLVYVVDPQTLQPLVELKVIR